MNYQLLGGQRVFNSKGDIVDVLYDDVGAFPRTEKLGRFTNWYNWAVE